MKSQFEHKEQYLGYAYKAGLTLQHNIYGVWVDTDPTSDPSISPRLFPEHWRVKEHVYDPDAEAHKGEQ